MKVEILGSAGAIATPRPGCGCRVCVEARERGIPYARTGTSVFLHGPDLLFDTPEESRLQLDRAGIERIAGCFYSHWHPDHTQGRRVWETRNGDFRTWPPEAKRREETPIYLPEQVALDFRTYLGLWQHFEFMAGRGWIIRQVDHAHVIKNNKVIRARVSDRRKEIHIAEHYIAGYPAEFARFL